MHKLAYALLATAVGSLALVTVAAVADSIRVANLQLRPTYDLAMTYRQDRFVLDHSMTIEDCVDALPNNSTSKHISFECVLADD